ncbi:MAG TPA: hypothetical protein VFJ16_11370 [Longimicrobium sp.]|nr:hypothetical protein [Longimicrobium sp.]
MAEVAEEGDSAPVTSLVYSVVGKDEEPVHALGEYTAATYPAPLADALRRREAVAAELRAMNIATEEGRRANLERIRELLATYPHPLAYEALIMAFVDQRRWDEAKGVAFAARERRWEVEHSPWPEIRAEIARLRAWSPDDVDELRREALGELVTPGVPNRAAAAEPAAVTPGLATALG